MHRDIKPANIFVCRYGLEYDFVKVLDFGLVKSVGLAEDAGLTAVGVVAGTPEYMAPEIARGERRFDHRADLYSVGCVANRLLSGGAVFDGKSPVDFLIDQVRSTPVRPSIRAGVPIPAALEDIVMDCLEKDPAKRPQSAGELARRLEALPLDPWTPERADVVARRRARSGSLRGADMGCRTRREPRRGARRIAVGAAPPEPLRPAGP